MHTIKVTHILTNIRNIRLPWLIITLLVFVALIKLGLWQIDRAHEKQQRLARIEQLQHQQALSLQQVLKLANEQPTNLAETINDLPVLITAFFDPKLIFLLDNQANGNSLGYRAFQVVRSEKQTLLVNLGWLAGSVDRNILPDITPLSGLHTFRGNVRLMEMGLLLQQQQFNHVQWPLRVQQIELKKFSILIGEKLLPFVVYLDKEETLGFVKNWHPVVMPPEKHQAYAFQWFSLAVAWLVLMIWTALKNTDQNNSLENEQGLLK